MKNKFKKISLLSAFFVFGILFFVACTVTNKITIETIDNITVVQPGQSVELATNVVGDLDLDQLIYEVATNNAEVSDSGVLIINTNAKVGEVVEVVARINNTKSNKITLRVVDLHIESLEISSTQTELGKNNETVLNVSVLPENATAKNYNFRIVKGEGLADISYNPITKEYSLRVKDVDIVGGEKVVVEVYSEHNEEISDQIEFTLVVIDNEIYTENLTLTSEKLELAKNESAELVVKVLPENATIKSYNFNILEGEEFAEVSYNPTTKAYSLRVKDVELNGGEKVIVQVYSEYDNTITAQLEFALIVVDNEVYAEGFEFSADKLELARNEEVVLAVRVLPENATIRNFNFNIIEGSEYAGIIYNPITREYSLQVKDAKFEGGERVVVQVYLEYNHQITAELVFNLVVIDNEIYTTEINLTSPKTTLYENEETDLIVSVLPENATVKEFSFEIVSGAEYANILYNATDKTYKLQTKNLNLNEDKTVLVRVFNNYNNSIYSELEFNVLANRVSNIVLYQNSFLINTKSGAGNPNLSPVALDRTHKIISDQQFVYSIVSGNDFVEVDQNGNIEGIGHGIATVRVSAQDNTDVFADAEITVINPPERLELPDELELKTGVNYSYSNRTLLTFVNDGSNPNAPVAPDDLEFVPFVFKTTPVGFGQNVAQNIRYTFKNGNSTGDSVAVYDYDTNQIDFKMFGKTTITATSDSSINGYDVNPIFETSVSFTVNVNNGFNASTYEQFKYYMEHLDWTVNESKEDLSITQVINILTDLTPTADKLAQGVSANSMHAEQNRVVYGNGYKIDISGQAYTGGNNALIRIRNNHANVISFEMYDLSFYGNYGIKGSEYTDNENSVNQNAIQVHGYNSGQSVGNTYIQDLVMQNVHVSGFREALDLRYVVNGLVADSSITNIYHSGIKSSENIIEFRNMTYSNIGAFGLFITPDKASNEAGPNFNQISQVKISGYTNSDNLNDGTTESLSEGDFAQVPVLLASGIVGYIEENNWNEGSDMAENVWSHFQNEDGKYNLFSLLYIGHPQVSKDADKIAKWGQRGNTNNEVVNYQTDDLMGSIIHITDLDGETINTTHKFIKIDVVVPGAGIYIGEMIVVNLNYQGSL